MDAALNAALNAGPPKTTAGDVMRGVNDLSTQVGNMGLKGTLAALGNASAMALVAVMMLWGQLTIVGQMRDSAALAREERSMHLAEVQAFRKESADQRSAMSDMATSLRELATEIRLLKAGK